LTNLELEKFGKDRYGLPLDERQRTENILRRALEVEQGVVDKLEVTEEHPDGLDLSLFHDESQLKRKRRSGENESDDSSSDSESDSKEGKRYISKTSFFFIDLIIFFFLRNSHYLRKFGQIYSNRA